MKFWIERGFSRLPIAQRMLRAQPSLELYTSPAQTPVGATPLAMPQVAARELPAAIEQMIIEYGFEGFWPQNSAKVDLSELSCAVHAAGKPGIISLVDDKNAFMNWLGDDPYRPDQVEAIGAEGVEHEYHKRQAQGRITCVKPAVGVNGHGYWKLLSTNGYGFLDDPEPREIDSSVWIGAMRMAEREAEPRRMLVMDWLPGPEVSVDMLCWYGQPLIHAARTKIDANHQRIEGDHVVVDHVRSLVKKLSLHGIISVQYRLDSHGSWRILEINPRPAGGSIHSEDADFNIISAWAGLIIGAIQPKDCRQIQSIKTVRFMRKAEIIEEN